jgi:hypothetical protein
VARGQCDCIYYLNSYRWDFPIVAALIAPRPLLILSGQKDTIFPPDGYHEVFQRGQKVYDLYAGPGAKSDRIREVDDNVEHSDPPLFRREARQWMQQWLKGDSTPLPWNGSSFERKRRIARVPGDDSNGRNQLQNPGPICASSIFDAAGLANGMGAAPRSVDISTEKRRVLLVSHRESSIRDPGFEEHRRLARAIRLR